MRPLFLELFQYFDQFKYIIPTGLITAASLYFVSKQIRIDTVFLAAGAFTQLVITIAFPIIHKLAWSGKFTIEQQSRILAFGGWISFIGGCLFAAGICILIYQITMPDRTKK